MSKFLQSNRPYSCSPYWMRTRLQWRLMGWRSLKSDKCHLDLKRLPALGSLASYNPVQKGWDTFQKMTFFISYLFINTIFANPFPPKCCGLGFLISGLSASRIKQLCNGGVRGGCKKSTKTQRSENYSLDVQKNAMSQRVLTGKKNQYLPYTVESS